ncbi:hypothetical protein RHMOL_Rhmol10G0006400 [Rhododendron molle]|uniref:Uncharacterized protein n=1 Tax=Rhododendron molle TaxID=49168 RepID=A0ACC0LZ78_RHOML|nr:hypothetical protein RHMOL_Rhmol10G0006400 [Rhododendron molle]
MEGSRKIEGFSGRKNVNPSYYRTAVNYYASKAPKPSSTPSASSSAATPAAAAAAAAASPVVFIVNHDSVTPQPKQTVFLSPKEISGTGRGDWWSFYSGGVTTYKNVDLKAASYIARVQERFRVE